MRLLQFWVLMLCSCFVSFLYVRQIFLTREIDQEQRLVVDSQEAVSEGDAYENAWKQLAMSIYQNSRTDPVLLDVLRKEGVDVRATPPATPPAAAPTMPGTTPTAPSVPLKAPVSPPHTTT